MNAKRVGRPRARQRPDSGMSPRDELLAAAAELFTTRGYTATTTRAVAERAGLRQASMYHYVGGKEDLLAELLESTVTPSLNLARTLLADTARPAEARLWELCRSDAELLCAGPHNLGALYLLPEVASPRFGGFHQARTALKSAYGRLLGATACCAALTPAELGLRTDLLFALIEGLILVHRSTPTRPVPLMAAAAADAALRIAGVAADDLAGARAAFTPGG
ncbi:TetR/AcrR family transcriptional regulator [Streptomyces sp. NBC_01190]|uniref:TetR/AcrR family transcriptional regulator n=1 Tax=Streptomyces sp. NBC_01190 TaxID=2903767 RepID=UPI00386D56E6|nr:TetR/AcrR family transcriptional regulator [Streptomyces sp. NBC_01190]